MIPDTKNKRIFGLDLVRAIAIVCVLLAHFIGVFLVPIFKDRFVAGVFGKVFSYPLGVFGVEIFFVLSGYLIGRIIIKKIVEENSLKNLFNFYTRRWLRTLPLYFLVIALLLFAPYANDFYWQNLLFIQNFNPNALDFNPVSWSLSIEEYFYLIVPFIVFLVFYFYKGNKAKAFMWTCVCIVVLSIVARVWYINNFTPNFDYGIRKQIFLRLDSLTIGVLFAGMRYYYRAIYDRLIQNRKLVLAVSLVALFLIECYLSFNTHNHFNNSFFARVMLFPLISLCCGFFMISLENIKIKNTYSKYITTISLTSYALYLVHLQIFLIFANFFTPSHIVTSAMFGFLAIVLTFGFSFALYRYYELPIMKFRDKITLKENR